MNDSLPNSKMMIETLVDLTDRSQVELKSGTVSQLAPHWRHFGGSKKTERFEPLFGPCNKEVQAATIVAAGR